MVQPKRFTHFDDIQFNNSLFSDLHSATFTQRHSFKNIHTTTIISHTFIFATLFHNDNLYSFNYTHSTTLIQSRPFKHTHFTTSFYSIAG